MRLNQNAKKLVTKQIWVMLNCAGKSGSSGRWPMPVLKSGIDASIHSEPFVAQAFYQRVQQLKKKGHSLKQIANLFDYPSGLARLTMITRSRMIWHLTKKQQIQMFNDLADILSNIYRSNKFCSGGKNILWSGEQKEQEEEELRKPARVKKTISQKTITKLDGRLWLYSEMIFPRWHNLIHEFHGPYGKREKLLVKEWHDLKGPGWKIFSGFPYDKIICYEFYKNNSVKFDIHNRMITKRPSADTITSAFVKIGDKFVNKKEVLKLLSIIDKYLAKGADYLSKRTKNDLKIMNAVMEFYSIKPLADELNQNWRPPKAVYDSIKRKRFDDKTKKLLKRLRNYHSNVNLKNVRIQYDPTVAFR